MSSNMVIVVSLFVLFLLLIKPIRKYKQRVFIKKYKFPYSINIKLSKHYPHLSEEQVNMILEGLKKFFIINNMANKQSVAMPSQAVDLAWHEFILYTKAYSDFSKKGIGRFLHHTPTEAMSSPTIAELGIKRAWKLSCTDEKIDSEIPSRLPVLFAIDSELDIPDGFKYSLNCIGSGSINKDNTFCVSHIGCIADGVKDGAGETSCASCSSNI